MEVGKKAPSIFPPRLPLSPPFTVPCSSRFPLKSWVISHFPFPVCAVFLWLSFSMHSWNVHTFPSTLLPPSSLTPWHTGCFPHCLLNFANTRSSMVVYRVWNNHQVNYVKNDISIMHFVFLCLAQDFEPWNDICKMFPAICALDLTLANFDSWM